MNDLSSCNIGYVIATVSDATGATVLEAALGVAALLGGIAGPGAGISGPCGDLIHPALNLIVAGADSPQWRRAEELLLGPIERCQQLFRDASQATNPERLDALQFSKIAADYTNSIVENQGDILDPFKWTGQERWCRQYDILRKPGFLLRSPSPEGFDAGLAHTIDRSPLILYPDGQLLTEALRLPVSKPWTRLIEQVSAVICGQDQLVSVRDKLRPCRLEMAKGSLFITCTEAQLGQAVISENPALERLIPHCLLLGRVPREPRVEIGLDSREWGYSAYDRAVRGILGDRRAGQGSEMKATSDALLAMHSFAVELEEWLDALPPRLKPFFGDSLSLPYRLLWSFTTALAARETDEWCLPLAIHVTQAALAQQRALLESFLTAAEGHQKQRERAVMLSKLESGPCCFRDLLRRYRVQRRNLHEPLLKELIRDGLVMLLDDNKIELSAAGRKQLILG